MPSPRFLKEGRASLHTYVLSWNFEIMMQEFTFAEREVNIYTEDLCLHGQDVDQRWSEYQSRFSSLLQWSRQHTALMANKSFPHNPVELKVSMYDMDVINIIAFILMTDKCT